MKIFRTLKAKILATEKPETPRQRKVKIISFDQWRIDESEIKRYCDCPGLVSVSICSLDQRLYCAVVYEEGRQK